MAFYLSADKPTEFYILSFCYSLADLEQAETILNAELFSNPEIKGSRIEWELFRLSWEYRLMHLTPVASHLRLTTFPRDYPQGRLDEVISLNRQTIRQTPGSIGAWLGRSITGETKILSRGDWNSITAQFEYVGSQVLHDARIRRQVQGIEAHYASFELHSVIRPESISI